MVNVEGEPLYFQGLWRKSPSSSGSFRRESGCWRGINIPAGCSILQLHAMDLHKGDSSKFKTHGDTDVRCLPRFLLVRSSTHPISLVNDLIHPSNSKRGCFDGQVVKVQFVLFLCSFAFNTSKLLPGSIEHIFEKPLVDTVDTKN